MPNSEIEYIYCILCGQEELLPLERYQSAHLVQCLSCSLVFSSLKTSPADIENLQKQLKWKEHITEDTRRRYDHILDRFEHFRKNGRILDLDCSHGEFLEMAKNRGWEVYGTADTAAKYALCKNKGLNMVEGAMNIEHFEEDFFDIVCARNVLEHLINPVEEITKMHRILRSGGLLYVTTPNFNSYLRYRLKEKYSIISYPLRLVYYNRKSLKRLMKQTNFKVFETESAGVSISIKRLAQARSKAPLTEESDFIEWEEDGQETRESKFERLQRKNLGPIFSFFGIGDILKGWFIKP